MYVNYKINRVGISNGATATTINLPINIKYQFVDNAELIQTVFIDKETQKSINPILDYEKARFIPLTLDGKNIDYINYNINFLNVDNQLSIPTYYSEIGFENTDIKQNKNNFTESYLYLGFYDSDNLLTQNLISEIQIYNTLSNDDYYKIGAIKPAIAGQPKPANEIPVRFVLSNPTRIRDGFYEGYYIYNYKDEYSINLTKSLYMRANYFNGKTGKNTNLMTEPNAYMINDLVNKLHVKYDLFKDNTGYFYKIDNTYSKNIKYTVSKNPNNFDVSIDLYQVQTL